VLILLELGICSFAHHHLISVESFLANCLDQGIEGAMANLLPEYLGEGLM
jgi:hypothetical protein